MSEMEITMNTILAIAGGVSVIGGAGAILLKWVRPAINVSRKVNELELKLEKQVKVLHELNEMDKAQSLAIISLINHQIDGDGIGRMQEERDKLLTVLAERKY